MHQKSPVYLQGSSASKWPRILTDLCCIKRTLYTYRARAHQKSHVFLQVCLVSKEPCILLLACIIRALYSYRSQLYKTSPIFLDVSITSTSPVCNHLCGHCNRLPHADSKKQPCFTAFEEAVSCMRYYHITLSTFDEQTVK